VGLKDSRLLHRTLQALAQIARKRLASEVLHAYESDPFLGVTPGSGLWCVSTWGGGGRETTRSQKFHEKRVVMSVCAGYILRVLIRQSLLPMGTGQA
jgi:hypothetical protein